MFTPVQHDFNSIMLNTAQRLRRRRDGDKLSGSTDKNNNSAQERERAEGASERGIARRERDGDGAHSSSDDGRG